MISYLLNISGAINTSLRFLFLFFLLQTSALPQTATNLDKFYRLVDSASTLLIKDIDKQPQINLELTLGSDYSIFANRIRSRLIKNGITIFEGSKEYPELPKVNLVLDNAFVEYGKPEKEGVFGDYYTERKISLSGNYFISNKSETNNFALVEIDSVKVDAIEKLENRGYPFTKGEIPSEPFFSSLFEPAVAIGAAAITIILFFSVRSK